MTKHPSVQVLEDMVVSRRKVVIDVTAAWERRLRAQAERIKASDSDAWPDNEPWDETIKFIIEADIDRGLSESERDDGLQGLMTGELIPYKKLGLKLRMKLAWQELRGFHRAGK